MRSQTTIFSLLGHGESHIMAICAIAIGTKRRSGGINENHIICAGGKSLTNLLPNDNTLGIIFCEANYGDNFILILLFCIT